MRPNRQCADDDFSVSLGDHRAIIEIWLPKTLIYNIPAYCFNQQQKTRVFCLVYEH